MCHLSNPVRQQCDTELLLCLDPIANSGLKVGTVVGSTEGRTPNKVLLDPGEENISAKSTRQ